jgi:branched-chain amino acid transport system substrate-binding protein
MILSVSSDLEVVSMMIVRAIRCLVLIIIATGARADSPPVLISIDAEFGVVGSTSAQAIRLGAQIASAEGVLFVSNEWEGIVFITEVAALPKEQRLPILAAWGITRGRFFESAGPALKGVDLAVNPVAERVIQVAQRHGIDGPRRIPSPVEIAHAHILAQAIQMVGSTDRSAVRDALERVTNDAGLVKTYPRPLAPDRHDALSSEEVFMARYAEDGAIARTDSE